MRRLTRTFVLSATALTGCGGPWSLVGPEGPQETFAISETHRLAKIAGKDLKAVITDTPYMVPISEQCPIGCIAAAWYSQGTVYWYRPWLAKQAMEDITITAAHEVCHAFEWHHNTKHEQCQRDLLNGLPYKG